MSRVHSPEDRLIPSRTEAVTVADILTAAADIVAKPGAWTKGAFARTDRGRVIGPAEANAVCFCGVGSVYRVSGPGNRSFMTIDTLDGWARRRRQGFPSFAAWNDAPGRTQAEVVAALREAARKAAVSTPSQPGTEASSEAGVNP